MQWAETHLETDQIAFLQSLVTSCLRIYREHGKDSWPRSIAAQPPTALQTAQKSYRDIYLLRGLLMWPFSDTLPNSRLTVISANLPPILQVQIDLMKI